MRTSLLSEDGIGEIPCIPTAAWQNAERSASLLASR